MAVPGGDQRDYDFAVKFGLPVIYTVTPLPDSGDDLANYEGKAPFVSHDGIVINSSVEATEAKGDALSLNGLRVDDAIAKVNAWLESAGVGKGTVSYRLAVLPPALLGRALPDRLRRRRHPAPAAGFRIADQPARRARL